MNLTKRVSCFILLALAVPSIAAPPVKAKTIRPERELLITHPAVVDSEAAKYPGAWSFGALVEELVGKDKAPEATRQWLEYFAWESQPATAHVLPSAHESAMLGMSLRGSAWIAWASLGRGTSARIPPRSLAASKVILPWQARDGYDARSGQAWQPNLANAPFRLLAIVNRMDLAAPQLAKLESQLESQWKGAGRAQDFTRMKDLATGTTSVPVTFGRRSSGRQSFGMGYGGSSSDFTDAGEGRLIFGAIDSDGQPLEGGWTVIFEYKLPTSPGAAPGCPPRPPEDQSAAATRAWAQAWHRLADFELGDHRFNVELEQLTKRFTHREPPLAGDAAAAPRARTNDPLPRSPGALPVLGQLRSSEAAFGPGREFRQFVLQGEAFIPAVLPMTPGPEYMEGTRESARLLSSFLRTIQPLIIGGIHSLPAELDDRGKARPLLGGRATIPEGNTAFHWEPTPRLPREARRIFSLNTCNGCHAADTGCPDGLHVHPRGMGESSKLSSFLRMDGKANRFQDPGVKSSWVQQREMEDRAAILAALLEPKESRRLDALAGTLKERLRRGH